MRARRIEAGAASAPVDEVRVWDPLVRLFHWSLVTALAVAFLAEDSLSIHEAAGYVALALIGLRIVWGFLGSRHARFVDFVPSPRSLARYLSSLAHGRAERHLGHNPAGGVMILALLTGVAAVGISGWLTTTDRFWGVRWLEDLHELLAYGLLVLVGCHVLGVLVSSLLHRENLVRAMIVGRKRREG